MDCGRPQFYSFVLVFVSYTVSYEMRNTLMNIDFVTRPWDNRKHYRHLRKSGAREYGSQPGSFKSVRKAFDRRGNSSKVRHHNEVQLHL